MVLEYEIKDRDGQLCIVLDAHLIFGVYYQSERVASPISKEDAEKLVNELKCRFETEYPTSELDEEEYKSHTDELINGFLRYLCDDGDCCCE